MSSSEQWPHQSTDLIRAVTSSEQSIISTVSHLTVRIQVLALTLPSHPLLKKASIDAPLRPRSLQFGWCNVVVERLEVMLSISGQIYQGPFCNRLSPTQYAVIVLYPTVQVCSDAWRSRGTVAEFAVKAPEDDGRYKKIPRPEDTQTRRYPDQKIPRTRWSCFCCAGCCAHHRFQGCYCKNATVAKGTTSKA
eukprot:53648-Chlamydomonas_euryale.AAC.2